MTYFSSATSVLFFIALLPIQRNTAGVIRKQGIILKAANEEVSSNEVQNNHDRHLDSPTGDESSNGPHQKMAREKSAKSEHKHFGYGKHNGPRVWGKVFEMCGGSSQSPVNLDTSRAISVNHPHIVWWNYALKPKSMSLTNNGHTARSRRMYILLDLAGSPRNIPVVLNAEWEKEEDRPYHWMVPEGKEYLFDQLHFHWGSDDHSGSEHTINNERFALEMHVVHHRKDLGSLQKAALYLDGIRVIAVLFRVSETEHNNSAMQQVVSALPGLREADTMETLTPFPLSRLVPQFSRLFFMYNGSLTTPPCAETVSWVVNKDPLTISGRQMEEFRTLTNHEGHFIKENYRPIQPLNGRMVEQIR